MASGKIKCLLDKALADLEETKMMLAKEKFEMIAERQKHEKEMTAAKEEVLNQKMRQLQQERELEEKKNKLVELASEKEKHFEEFKTCKEEMLNQKMRQLLLESELDETKRKLMDEKKKHKKNLKNFIRVLNRL